MYTLTDDTGDTPITGYVFTDGLNTHTCRHTASDTCALTNTQKYTTNTCAFFIITYICNSCFFL